MRKLRDLELNGGYVAHLRLESSRMYLCGEMRDQLAKLPGRWGKELVRRAAGDSEGG